MLLQVAVEQQERSAIEQEMPPCDVNKWMREPAPPFAVRGGMGHEDEACIADALENSRIEGDEEKGETGEFEFVPRLGKGSSLTSATTQIG